NFLCVEGPPEIWALIALFKEKRGVWGAEIQPPEIVLNICDFLPQRGLIRIAGTFLASRWIIIPIRQQKLRETAPACQFFWIGDNCDLRPNTRPYSRFGWVTGTCRYAGLARPIAGDPAGSMDADDKLVVCVVLPVQENF